MSKGFGNDLVYMFISILGVFLLALPLCNNFNVSNPGRLNIFLRIIYSIIFLIAVLVAARYFVLVRNSPVEQKLSSINICQIKLDKPMMIARRDKVVKINSDNLNISTLNVPPSNGSTISSPCYKISYLIK